MKNPQMANSNRTPRVVESYFEDLAHVIEQLPYRTVNQIILALLRAYHEQRTIFIFGNGGSAATASHMICDLGKGATAGNHAAKRLRVMALTDNVPMITAWANDSSYEDIFAEQLTNFVQPGDVAFAISGSGNSPNVLKALRVARNRGAVTLGLTGFQGGAMKDLCDVCVVVPSDNMQIIEDLHHAVAHALFSALRQCITGSVKADAANPEFQTEVTSQV